MTIFILWLFFPVIAAVMADQKGRSGVGFLFLSIVLSPSVGVIAASVARPNIAEVERSEIESGFSRFVRK
jgi:hypothetical protein